MIALVGSILWAIQWSDGSTDAAVDCSVTTAETFEKAGSIAAACGAEVEVIEARTPWTTTWATEDGYNRLEQTMSPSRTSVTGEWTDIDTSLAVEGATGTISPVAPVYAIELNGGGDNGVDKPLGTITRDGMRLEVGSPLTLPEPEVSGTQAVYQIAEGIRLIVTVSEDGTGFFPVFELASPEAATRLAGALAEHRSSTGAAAVRAGNELALAFPVSVPAGLRLEADGAAVQVVDDQGDAHFVVPPPVMWDSAASELSRPERIEAKGATGAIGVVDDRLAAPLPGDRVAQMGTRVEADSVVVDPDDAMLTGSDTVWPVYVDPGFSGHGAAEWIAIRKGGYTGTLYKWGDISPSMPGEGDGYCTAASCNVVFTQRLVWEYGGMDEVRNLVGSDVVSAQFRVNGVHSASCTATTTDLYVTGAISSGTTWNSLSWLDVVGSRTEAHSASCGNQGWREYNATNALRLFADKNLSTITLGLKARDESSMTSWKRFRHDATLSVTYNRAPNTPSSLKLTNPLRPTCSTGVGQQLINSKTPTLSAIVSDPDGGNVSPKFQVYTKSGTTETEVWNSWTLAGRASGTRASATVASNKLAENTVYLWRVISKDDGGRWSGWSVSCEFMVDIQKPNAPTVTPVASGADIQAVYERDVERGGKGLKGKFTLGPNGSTDVVAFKVSFGDPSALASKTVTAGSSLVTEHVPAASGPMTLYVESVDRAGNVSPRTEYKFDVASPMEDAIWKLDEGSGTTAADTGPKNVGPLTITGAGWGDGPHELFGSRDGDSALKFDGVDDVAQARGPVVDTTKPFVVSAHVWLDPAEVTAGSYGAVLAQDGVVHSGFRLRYNPLACAETAGSATQGCWNFLMMATDQQGVTTHAPVRSTVEVRPGEWVNLVAEHDPAEKKVRLWVCNVGTPDNPGSGEPVMSEATIPSTFTPWQAAGAFTVGRAKHNGNSADRFKGYIDNVRVFSGEVVDEAKVRRLCQGAEAEDYATGAPGLNALDPTVSEQ